MSSKETYKENCRRVREIYGIGVNDSSVNVHHIIQRSDKKKHPELWRDYNINQKSNLIPLKREIHQQVHDLINAMEPPDQPKHRRKHRR